MNVFVGANATGKSTLLSAIDECFNDRTTTDLWPMTPEQMNLRLTFGEETDYFVNDAGTGEIVPRSGLPKEARERALQTIDDLGLNKVDMRYYRLNCMRRFTEGWQSLPSRDRLAFAEFATRTGGEFAGATLMVAQQLRTSEEK